MDDMELNWYKKMAIDTFNAVWELMDKKDRTYEETLRMLHTAHASAFHWSFAGGAVNQARGEWQVSRAYCEAGMPDPALYHASASLAIGETNSIGDFDLTFAYEAVSRALKLSGDDEESRRYLHLCRESAKEIGSEDDRNYLLSELGSIWE